MITLENILIKETRIHDLNTILYELATVKLYANFSYSVCVIDKLLKNIKDHNFDQCQFKIGHIIQLVLIKSNVVLDSLELNSKLKIREIISSILGRLYNEIILNLPCGKRIYFIKNMEQLWGESAFIFDLKNCHFNCLYRLNKFWEIVESNKATQIKIDPIYIPVKKTCGLIWNNRTNDSYQSFLKLIVELGVAKPTIFRQLFENPCHKLELELNSSNPNFVLQFLCCLKESKLVSYYNTNGFYQVFRTHFNDFDQVFLKNKKPKRRVDTVKNLVTWHINKEQVERAFKLLL
ncbi:MAG: hypothetical protein GQ574_19735 [Crocinitomix sp.]|nr:hypothetical protein [Crocinitomix sp.]